MCLGIKWAVCDDLQYLIKVTVVLVVDLSSSYGHPVLRRVPLVGRVLHSSPAARLPLGTKSFSEKSPRQTNKWKP